MRAFSPDSKLGQWIMSRIKGYNHEKYWRRRAIVVNAGNDVSLLRKLYYLWYIKRTDARMHCSFGTNLNSGSFFAGAPRLPHGSSGIIVGLDLTIGSNVIINQHVTIAHGGGKIGDFVELGAGAVVLKGVNIGHHAKIGANAVVVEDLPPYATCVMQKPRVILRNSSKKV